MTNRNPLARVLFLLVIATLAVMTLGAPRAHAEDATADAAGDRSATIVVLVDESGSLSASDFAEQVRAVRMLKNVPNIDLYVYGFASGGTLPPVYQVCGPDSDLDECTADLHRRTESEGNDTDHARALGSAALPFQNGGFTATEPRIVLLMTDGRFDPDGSGSPGDADNARLSDAMQNLAGIEVQVWPLGFGDADVQELDRIAEMSFSGTCDGGVSPESVIVSDIDQVPSAVISIIGSATCASGDFVIPDGTQTVVVLYTEDELGNSGTNTATNEQGVSVTTQCVFDALSGQWVCKVPTDELGFGMWGIAPDPVAFPILFFVPFPTPGDVVLPPATTIPATVTPTDASPSTTVTTVEQGSAEEVPNESSSGLLWVLAVLGTLGLGVLAWALLRDRTKLARGVVAVRAASHNDWSPEETVRAEKRQGFEVDPDDGYPSIAATSVPAPDVILEATRKGLFVSGSMIDRRRPIRLGDEIDLIDGMKFTYVDGFDHDIDEDLYDDTFV